MCERFFRAVGVSGGWKYFGLHHHSDWFRPGWQWILWYSFQQKFAKWNQHLEFQANTILVFSLGTINVFENIMVPVFLWNTTLSWRHEQNISDALTFLLLIFSCFLFLLSHSQTSLWFQPVSGGKHWTWVGQVPSNTECKQSPWRHWTCGFFWPRNFVQGMRLLLSISCGALILPWWWLSAFEVLHHHN